MKDHIIAAVNIVAVAAVAGCLIRALFRDRHPRQRMPLRLRFRWWLRCHGTVIRKHEDAEPPAAGRLADVMRSYRRQAGPEALGAEETARFCAERTLSGREDS